MGAKKQYYSVIFSITAVTCNLDDDGDGKIEEDGNDYNNNYGGEKGDDNKKGGGKVVGGIIDESKEENDDNKGPQKRCSNRKKSRVKITDLGR